MVVLKHAVVLLASLATLAAASPASAQWQSPDTSASATGVAHHGKPSGAAAGGDGEGHERSDWQNPAQEDHEEGEHKGSFQKGGGGDDNANHHQARDDDAPTKHRAFANHKGAGGSQHKSGGMGDTDKTVKQHHARTEEVLDTLRRIAHQEQDHDKHPRDVDHDSRMDDHGHGHDMEHESLSQTQTGEHGKGKHHDTRAPTQRGVYECANHDWVHPCTWTPLKDGQCYNRKYGSFGSMGPDNGLSCTIYEQPNCNDKGWNTAGPFVWPGIKNYQTSHLLLMAGMPDDGPLSIKCKYT